MSWHCCSASYGHDAAIHKSCGLHCGVDNVWATKSFRERLGPSRGLVCEELLSGIQKRKGRPCPEVLEWPSPTEKRGTSCRLMRVFRSRSHSGVSWGKTPHSAHPPPHCPQRHKHTSDGYLRTCDIGSTPYGRNVQANRKCLIPDMMQAQKALRVSERWYAGGNGLFYVFLINRYARDTNFSARANWIFSSDTSTSESVRMTPREKF